MARMSDARDRLKDLEREVKEAAASERATLEKAGVGPSGPSPGPKPPKRSLRKGTKQKILVGTALILTFLLVWKKVNIHFVIFTSFWGFLGILGTVFVIVLLVLHFFFGTRKE